MLTGVLECTSDLPRHRSGSSMLHVVSAHIHTLVDASMWAAQCSCHLFTHPPSVCFPISPAMFARHKQRPTLRLRRLHNGRVPPLLLTFLKVTAHIIRASSLHPIDRIVPLSPYAFGPGKPALDSWHCLSHCPSKPLVEERLDACGQCTPDSHPVFRLRPSEQAHTHTRTLQGHPVATPETTPPSPPFASFPCLPTSLTAPFPPPTPCCDVLS